MLAQFCVGDAGRLTRYLNVFIDSFQQVISEVDAALARQDLAALSALGHRLKSAAGAAGAAGLA
ncbi:MAG: Hpt domain-containing protein, partial [Burkholderiaceae bacterium]|nr:Hpt domain-containing protein [Burkholderiaceae bacterium]